jgi:hypothetical protein
MIQNEKMVPLSEASEQVKKIFIRLGMLHLSYAETLVNELGEKKGKELILKSIKDYGTRVGEKVKSRVAASGLNNNPLNYIEDLPLYGMSDSYESVEVCGEKRVRVHGCVIADMWRKLGKDKLGRLYCYVDLVKYMAFNPDYKQIHLKAIPDGDQYCEFAIRSTNEQERKDFADKDKDWSYID